MFTRYYQIVRCLHQTCLLMTRKPAMPGIRHQLGALENATDLADDPEALDDLEADFMHVGKTHRQHEEELKAQRERVKHLMVKQKYFREDRLPNLLLYAEKEEIRNLHARDPEEWTFERLAESFPATPEIVKKILKSKWRPYSAKRIHAHDEAVIRNWERLQGNKNDDQFIPPDLREHFSKFAARTVKHTTTEEHIKSEMPKPKSNEFSSIITSCKKYAEKPKESNSVKETRSFPKKMKVPDPEDETYLLEKVQDKRRMRLEDWQKQNMKQFEQLEEGVKREISDVENKIVVAPENPSGTGYIEKFESNEIVISAEDSKRYEISTYKERIHIPRKLYRKGGTYRIEDCYYDDDGEFLYRVPGMSGTQHIDSKRKQSNE